MWSKGRAAVLTGLLAAAALLCRPTAAAAADEEECLRCHGLPGLATRTGDAVRPLGIAGDLFESSVHTLLNCRECHSDIAAIPHPDASTAVSCGQPCHQRDSSGELYSHESLFWEFATSVHGGTESERVPCTTCHTAASLAGFAPRDLAGETGQCTVCHSGSDHVALFSGTLHYLALSRGDRRAPSCPDCHTAHRVLPPGDQESSVHPDRLASTCGSGALSRSATGRCHGEVAGGAVREAGMNALVLPGRAAGWLGWLFTGIYWATLAALLLRISFGIARKR